MFRGKFSAKWIILGISMMALIAICVVGLILYQPDTTNPGSKVIFDLKIIVFFFNYIPIQTKNKDDNIHK